jgi:DNA modification methylase
VARSDNSDFKPTRSREAARASGGKGPKREVRLKFLAPTELTLDARNPRKHSREQIRAIAKSIEAFGFNAPILIDRYNKLIAGHGRLEAAKLLGITRVPVICLEHLSEGQARAYMLADNQLTDRSSWDDGALAVHLKELSELALDFEIEAIGFETPEIDFRVQSLDAISEDAADEFSVTTGAVVSRSGDLWLLGSHRLYAGSALDPAAYDVLLEGDKAAAAFTDPPYNVRINGHASGKGKTSHREFPMAGGEMTEVEFTHFLRQMLGHLGTNCRDGGLIYSCMDWRHMAEMLAAAREAHLELLNLCVWAKTNGGMGTLYRSRHELIFVFRNGDVPHLNNVQLGRFGRNRSNVWNYAGANSFPRNKQKPRIDLHPTAKPVALVADAILDCTKRDDIVLDPFLGSGTTILAAERTGRRCYGIELDLQYVDTAIRRWQQFTGRQAKNSQGLTFPEVASERGVAL